MAKLPQRVQAQLEAADALLQRANPPEQTPEATTPPAEPQQHEPPAAQADPAPVVETPSQPSTPQVNWEHKFKTLQGLFNAEVPKLQNENKTLKSQLTELQQAVDQLKQGAVKETPSQSAAVDPRDVDAFGADLVGMVQRVVQASLASVGAKVDATVVSFEKRLAAAEQALRGTSETVAVTAEEMFFNRLSAAVPDWESVNADQRFLDWLGEVDPLMGQPRQAALDAAQKTLNAQRAVAVFQAFKATLPQTQKANPLDKQIAPKPSAPVAPTQQAPQVVEQSYITNFYSEMAKGKWRGREAEAKGIEDQINRAIAEGRVR